MLRRRTLIVTYAMENNAPERLFRPLPAPARRLVAAVIRVIARVIYDRIAFASPAAAACYRAARVLPSSVSTRDFLELQPCCDCAVGEREAGTVVFLGALAARKGLPDLLAAWEMLPARHNGWALRIAGTGPEGKYVRRAATSDPSIQHVGAADRDTVHALLR
jgi:glycosyltransferase involved in cell wall biosynthesis